MNARTKAKQLVKDFGEDLMGNAIESNKENKYRCAIRCIKEIKKGINNEAHGESYSLEVLVKKEEFWNDVLFQIEKLKEEGF